MFRPYFVFKVQFDFILSHAFKEHKDVRQRRALPYAGWWFAAASGSHPDSPYITTIYYKDTSGFVMSANKEELKSIIKRIRDAYNEIINNSLFEQCDNALRQLLLQQNIPDEMEDLYKILLSAEMLAQDSSTTILETYSIYTVDDIRTRLKKLDSLLELNSDFNYTITTDENDIRQRKRVDLMGLLMIHENLNYFSRLYKN